MYLDQTEVRFGLSYHYYSSCWIYAILS